MSLFLKLKDFARTCELAENAGLSVSEAKFDGRHFGYWYVEVCRKGLSPRMILWEARDGWVIVQTQRADGSWDDEWIVREPRADTIEEIIARLRE